MRNKENAKDAQHFSAILFIAGFATFLVAFLLGPKGIYQTPDLQRRLQIIEEYKSRWNIAQPLIGLSLLLTTIGFAVLASQLSTEANAWVSGLGAAAFAAGTISAEVFVFHQTTDPLGSFEGAYSSMETLYHWLTLAGLLLFGVAFLQAGLPAWLGIVTVGVTLLYGIVSFLVRSVRFLTPGLVSILSLVIAIYLLSQ